MNDADFLLWVRGTAFDAAILIFCVGMVARILHTLLMGRKDNLAEARGSQMAGGLATMVRRTIPDSGTFKRSSFTLLTGWVFHLGLLIIIFLFVPHILVFEDVLGLSWPGLPSNIIDATTVITMITLLLVLIHRLYDPVKRMLSEFNDYLVWAVTFLPVLTGWLAFHRVGAPPQALIAIHILSVELLLILFPFTKLSHAFTLWIARWYNGAIAGYKGVRS